MSEGEMKYGIRITAVTIRLNNTAEVGSNK